MNVTFGDGRNGKITHYSDTTIRFPEADPHTSYKCKALLFNDLNHPIVIGTQFMKENKADILLSQNKFRIGDCDISFNNDRDLADRKPDTTTRANDTHKGNDPIAATNHGDRMETIDTIINQFTTLSNNKVGCFPSIKHHIRLRNDSKPLNKRVKPYSFSHEDLSQLKLDIAEWLNKGVIKKSTSPICSPAFYVKKKGTSKKRLVIDYVNLNKECLQDHYPLPDCNSILQQLRDKSIFSKLDLSSGYFQVEVDEKSIPLTSFVVPGGQYEFVRMPFGLSTAPQTFTRAIFDLFKEIPDVYTYMDDILIASKNICEHENTLKQVLQQIKRYDINVNLKKSEFLQKEIGFLGQIISLNSIKADLTNFKQNKLLKIPTTVKQLRSLIGYLNFFRPYVENLSSMISQLNEKLKSSNFIWREEDKNLVKKIESMILRNQELAIPDFSMPYRLFCDASDVGLSGILLHQDKIVRIFSKKLSSAEENYSIVEREELAIIRSLENMKALIGNNEIKIFTDNKNLTFLRGKSARARRWRTQLYEYNFKIEHISGKSNTVADYHSRNFTMEIQKHNFNPDIYNNNDELKTYGNISWKDIDGSTLPFDKLGRLIILNAQVTPFLNETHNYLGHPGASKTKSTLRNFYTFKNFNQSIEETTRNCLLCAKNKKYKAKIDEVSGYMEAKAPRKKISSDLFGPFDKEEGGAINKFFILTISDVFSRYTKLKVLEEATELEVTKGIDECWINRFEAPSELITDNGKQFVGKEMKNLCARYNIKHRPCSPYNPTSNSISERISQVLGNTLRIFRNENIQKCLEIAERNLNETVNRTLKTTPSIIMNGRSIVDPLKRNLKTDLEDIYNTIKKDRLHDLEVNNKKRKTNIRFQIGDSVLNKQHIRKKLDEVYTGPYTIIELGGNRNKIRIANDTQYKWVNMKNLKLFKSYDQETRTIEPREP
eukprot:GAHX01002627.1.p1 GENE.GAHX01002627.1~~GAHX01002627.1.p1  ORF type:complete len:943 (-),score=146.49 GAHX01002627.1:47-2875(-)